MLDYKNNTIEQFENINDYFKSRDEEIDVVVKNIQEIKDKITNLQGFECTVAQPSLFESYDGFIELAAYSVDEILCAGEKPYSLFAQDEIIYELKNSGVTTIINLMQEHEFNMYHAEDINKEFKVVNIPIIDNSVPSLDVLYKIIHIIDSSKKTYIHCNLGLGRTGVIVGYYLYKKYAYIGPSIIQKIEALKLESELASKKSPITKEQIKFIVNLNQTEWCPI